MKLPRLITPLPVVITLAFFIPAQQAKAVEAASTSVPSKSTDALELNSSPTNDFACSYADCMQLGYEATEARNYEKALSYFTLALLQRPGDRYASLAYANVTTYIDANKSRSDYERYMRLGYAATKKKEYQTALYYFRMAFKERPDNGYASQAIRNVQAYINGSKFMSKLHRAQNGRVFVEVLK